MQTKFRLFCSVLIAIHCVAILPAEAAPLKMADLPDPVRQTIWAEAGKGRVLSISKEVDDGEVTYEAEIRKANKERSLTVDETGQLLDIEVFLNEVPAPVQAGIKKIISTNTLEGITKVLDEEISYEIEMTQNGVSRNFTVNSNGALQSIQMRLNELPEPVRKAVVAELHGRKPGDIYRNYDEAEVSYEVEIDPDGKACTLTVDPDGEIFLREEEMKAGELPAPVQKAVRDWAKDDLLKNLRRMTDKDSTSYVVECKRQGKWVSATFDDAGNVEK